MKTKTIFKMLAAAMLMPAMLLTTACSSDDDAVNDNANTQKKYYEIPVTVTVTRQGDEGTRAVYDSETKTLSFSAGDKLFVNGSHQTTGNFAGVLELVSATDGTFEGTVRSAQPYTGTAKAFLDDSDIHDVKATLLPAGYTNYSYLRLETYDIITTEAEITQYTIVSQSATDYYNSLLPLGKAEAVAQLSREYADGYSDNGSGKVFALRPQRPVICCTISGLPTNTAVPVVYDGGFEISGNITTDGSGTATFAFTDFPGSNLGTLTVNDNAITLPSGVQLAAGKVYNINRSVAPAPAATTVTWNFSAIGGSTDFSGPFTRDGIVLSCDGYGNLDFASGSLSARGDLTLSNTLGKNFTSIVINSSVYVDLSGFDFRPGEGKATWTGNASSITFSEPDAEGITSIVFTLE